MTNLETEPAPLPPPSPELRPEVHRWARSDDRVVFGVAGGLGRALAIEPLFVRVAFVVLALFSGIGVVLYVAALALLADSPTSRAPRAMRRIVGAVAILLSGRWLFSGDARLPDGGWVVAIGLLGAAVALWRGRSSVDTRTAPATARPLVGTDDGSTSDRWNAITAHRRARPPSRRSPLGLLTIGAATAIGAATWLVGGETADRGAVAFGVATIVLGLGLVVGAFAGRARWLIVPAVATSVAAVLAAAIGFAGVEIAHRNSDHTVFIQPGATVAGQYHSGVGDFHLVLTDHPTDVVTSIDVGIGDLTVDVPDDAHVQIDARVGLGSIDALGGSRNGYRRVLSIDDQKDRVHTIRLTLRVGVGSIEVRRGEVFQNLPIIQMPTTLETLPGVPPLQYFGDGSVQFQDGSIDFGDGRRIEADGTYQIPIVEQRADGSVQLDNGAVVRTDGTVVTPGGFVIARRPVEPAATTAPATATPTTTGVQP